MRDRRFTTFTQWSECTGCPRQCRVDRTSGDLGYCGTGGEFSVASVCAHRGEEPIISGEHGICNIFFTGCNMRCVYCQNHTISRPGSRIVGFNWSLDRLVTRIERHLRNGCRSVGFVSPSHVAPHVAAIADAVRRRGWEAAFVYNTNSYERPETVAALRGVIDVYLPDLKYLDYGLAAELSDTPDYPEVATAVLREMYRQKGDQVQLDDHGLMTSGLIIRHLVLPGYVENSRSVLRFIAEELSPDVYVSLMAQYCPTPAVANHPSLGRRLTVEEYQEVMDECERLGFHRGFTQELNSSDHYRPDFTKPHPFEDGPPPTC